MNDSDSSSSTPSNNVIPLRPSSSSLVVSTPEAGSDVGDMDESQGKVGGEDAQERAQDGLPTIFLDRDFHVVLDAAMKAMASGDPMLFAKGDQLVRVALEGDAPRLLSLGGHQLREVLSSCARWMKEEPVHPPSSVATTLAKRGEWRYLRELRALTAFPVLSPRGELWTEPGYDKTTKTFYHAACEVSVPERPSQKDAKDACKKLLDLVSDFPFAGPAHKSAWLAAVLTPLSRFMHDGNVPLVIIQANAPGSGKTTLAQLVSMITTGSTVSVMSCEKDEPNRKELLSKLRTSPSVAVIDNIVGRFGGANMNALITSRAFEDRALGYLKTLSAPNDTAWFATGNRIVLAPDLARRCLHIRLKSLVEKPHERTGFRYPNLMQHVREHRGELLSAALTILKAYAVTGFPDRRIEAWGSFEDWSRVVRGALLWCGLPDPVETRGELEAESEEGISEHAQLVFAWEELQTAMGRKSGATIKEALTFLAAKPDAARSLREMVESFPRKGGQADPNIIARRLREAKDRNYGGKMLQSSGNPKDALRWKVAPVASR
jgi:hypothetical protein